MTTVTNTPHRQRLLDGLTASLAEGCYRDITVADIVRRARTSRRTFYQHFADKDDCLVALLTESNTRMIADIAAAVDGDADWAVQVRQAVQAWIGCAETVPEIMLSWIRDVPSLGPRARDLQRELMEGFIAMVQALAGSQRMRADGVGPVSRPVAIILLGGLRELVATTVEDGGEIGAVTEVAVRAAIALLAPRP